MKTSWGKKDLYHDMQYSMLEGIQRANSVVYTNRGQLYIY